MSVKSHNFDLTFLSSRVIYVIYKVVVDEQPDLVTLLFKTTDWFRAGFCCSTVSPRCRPATTNMSRPTSSPTFFPALRSVRGLTYNHAASRIFFIIISMF